MFRRLLGKRLRASAAEKLQALTQPKPWAETEIALERRKAARATNSERSKRAARTVRVRETRNDPLMMGE